MMPIYIGLFLLNLAIAVTNAFDTAQLYMQGRSGLAIASAAVSVLCVAGMIASVMAAWRSR